MVPEGTDAGLTPVKPEMMSGLVKKDGDTVTFIHAARRRGFPKEFKTKDGQEMLVLKRFSAEPTEPNKFSTGP